VFKYPSTGTVDMVLSRRRTLQAVAAGTLTALAGCSATDRLDEQESTRTYALTVDRLDASPVEHALYEPDESDLFGTPARTALDAILPDGRHTTYGYTPLPDDAYLEHDGRYFQTVHLVTGRERVARRLVSVESVDEDAVPDDAIRVDSLDRPDARVVKILHSDSQLDGQSGASDLLRDDAYVLRRPAEREGRLATGDLDGRVVTMSDSGAWAYRVSVSRERIVETAYTTLAVEVATSRAEFREVVFGSRIDTDLADETLTEDVRAVLDSAIDQRQYQESVPPSASFERLLDVLGLAGVEQYVNGRLLWDGDDLYRYALYVDE
jgi:hypothetical protein